MLSALKNSNRPFMIAGPCSAESAEQVMEVARSLDTSRVDLLRAGIWKPRTRPDSFEGMGEKALPWLVEAGGEVGLPVTTEVASAAHVEACLKAGVDILWVGARSTVNPFSVQNIADALRGVDIPVLVKNPINPDLQLWIGAVERLEKAGIRQMGVIHRGFSHLGKSNYRNLPMWEIPIAMKTEFPDLPMYCDPSHINGNRDGLLPIAQKAIDLGMDGLMLETHPRPDEALSDAKQQITPATLSEILDALVWRRMDNIDPILANKLAELRASIDTIDDEIIRLLVARFDVTEEIGEYKKQNNLTILQLDRWKKVVEAYEKQWVRKGLSANFVKKYLEILHKESIRRQTQVMNQRGTSDSNEVIW
ncbi:MAG: bifunctional 3-deoxy-7-phosphoheptulonate synthase/chorismate mutase type II [Flavobacteriales bacterium]|nr:bifunctional 3-deoxy-7-phosphoheptulonate synthase/chorismate mutase type II [Flavobacteriales bacterium]